MRGLGACVLAVVGLAGCAVHRPTLQGGVLEPLRVGQRTAHLAGIEISDARPADELEALSPAVRYVVPLVVWNQWATEGHLRPDAVRYTDDLHGDMSALLSHAFATSGLFAPPGTGEALRIRLRIDHLYGVTHMASINFYPLVFASFSTRTFGAYGYAQAHLEVVDAAGRVLGTREVVGAVDPGLDELRMLSTGGMAPVAVMNARHPLVGAAAQAARNLATNVVRAVDLIIAGYPTAKPLAVETRNTFFLARALPEGPFLEVAEIDLATGTVVADTVVPRWMEPYAAIDEWVVDPYNGGQARLTQDEYDALVRRLQAIYDVRYVTDVRVAHFFGAKRSAAPTSL